MMSTLNILNKSLKKLTDREQKKIKERYSQLLRSAQYFTTADDIKKIRKAVDLALKHWETKRTHAGEPYVFHLLDISIILVEQIGLGTTSIVSSLLIDLVKSGEISLKEVKSEFDDKTAKIIEGLIKIFDVNIPGVQSEYEKYQKLLITMADDIRVILIKLAFILDYMRELNYVEPSEQVVSAMETFAVYAPLAHRLGLYNIKSELENLAMKYTEPEVYKEIIKKLKNTTAKRNKYIKKFCEPIEDELKKQGLTYELKGRPKAVYSIWQKMKKQNIEFEEVYDIFAIRIILESDGKNEKADCWRTFSIVTDFYQANPKRMRDWISIPKSNGYESLHTTVIGHEKKWVEVQIRTRRMDDIAEKGFAAHWKYKGVKSEENIDSWMASMRELLDANNGNTDDVIDDFKLNLYSSEVFAFTPNGELKKLPEGATVLDFAYAIHTQVGSQCIGAKINHQNVTIKQKIRNGDTVEILTSKVQKPKSDWLSNVVTSKAKTRIKVALREEKYKDADIGQELLKRRLKNWKIKFSDELIQEIINHYNLDKPVDLYYYLAKEKIDVSEIKEFILNKESGSDATIEEIDSVEPQISDSTSIPDDYMIIDEQVKNVDYKLAKCCSPIFGDSIFGFVTVSEGIKIHRTNCPNAQEMIGRYDYRVVKARWNKSISKPSFQTTIKISGIDEIGIVSKISDIITGMKVIIRGISFDTSDGMFEGNVKLYVDNKKHLDSLINKLKKEKNISKVVRMESSDQ